MINNTFVFDLNKYENQIIESLIIAIVFSKKYNKTIKILDLNDINNEKILKSISLIKKNNIYLSELLPNLKYLNCYDICLKHKENIIIKNYIEKNNIKDNILIINSNYSNINKNEVFLSKCKQIIIFIEFNDKINEKFLSFLLSKNLQDKNVIIFIYNYKTNIQNEKTYLSFLNCMRNTNFKIEKIDFLPTSFKTLDQIKDIDPWTHIYQKINKL